ncbi:MULTISPECIES: hypothetical protein [Desulfococcus]|jgi:hypothetical protein|uniref:Uncharacterized protein n=1 Tax=Desulfococcus multivorans DSM 2059 TaxID=1121405 RepID=S7U2Q9_DESML|nr:hypothetical protein [Desulfococcus multivorans]AOY58473.1 conserved uncharacterized protein [Desulfococcus multivorans]AQV00788.1 hypothetical protein B2D07_08420 [Desulfococcus multivorans]EPR43260.1 hypothetical protein dsmv_1286 [Desulfococcus multivorans DSM 2059]SJZ41431.1 hypothetical protein SAMN02745446_00402 [Desulfococcus multivorans DSM 2059]
MLDELRKPFFIAAVVAIFLVVLVELGSGFTVSGIFYLGILDSLVLFTILLVGAPLVITHRFHGRIQGVVTFLFSFLMFIGSVAMVFAALGLLLLMVSLLMAIPFGPIVYLKEYGRFDRTAAAATLSLAMALKLGFSVLMMLAHQRFLENKGLVLIVLTSFIGTILLGFLHGLFPRFLASITDDIGAIVIAVLTLIWALFYLVGAIPAILKALRVDKSVT